MKARTLGQAADEAVEEYRRNLDREPATPDELARIAERLIGPTAGRLYHSTFKAIIARCREEGWDLRSFVRAQVDGLHFWKGAPWSGVTASFESPESASTGS